MADHNKLGYRGEKLAFKFLQEQGYDIVARNVKGRSGEVDLVAYDGNLLAFIEVKTRTSTRFGYPFEAVSDKKQDQIRRVAEEFIARQGLVNYSYRFDIVSILFDERSQPKIELFKNAF